MIIAFYAVLCVVCEGLYLQVDKQLVPSSGYHMPRALSSVLLMYFSSSFLILDTLVAESYAVLRMNVNLYRK